MCRPLLGRLAFVASLLLLPALARAVPVITSITPGKSGSNNGDYVTVYCSDCGYSTDRVYFPGGSYSTPAVWSLNSWVYVRVPATWSGDVYMLKQGVGSASNSVNHDISYSWSGQKWFTTPFTWYLNNSAAPGVTFNDTRDALTAGYNAWSCNSGASMSFGGGTATAATAYDGVNCRYWTSTGLGSGTIALCTWFYNTSTNEILESDIAFNSANFTWSAYGTASTMSVENIGTHEEGHSIGLLDQYGSADAAHTMYGYGANGETQKNTLAEDDVLGAEFLYPHSRANFASGTPGGWYWTVVPRNTADANGASAALPATLNGNTTVYLNAAMSNTGSDCAAPGGTNQLFLDDDYQWDLYWGGVWGAGATFGAWTNLGTYVRGGRHTLRENMDTNNETIESNEGDNVFQTQYVFDPYTLTDQVPIARVLPPQPGPFGYPNCDGLRATGNWWCCVAITPYDAGDDYDLTLHDDYVGSTGGFGSAVAGSAYSGTSSDFVLVNGNVVGNGATRYMGIERYSAGSGGYVLVQQSNQVGGTLMPGSGYASYVTTGTVTMGYYDIVKVHEVYLSSTTQSYRFHLENLSGSADLNLSLYASDVAYAGKPDYVASSQTYGSATNEDFDYTPPVAGWYGVVVWKRSNADIGLANDYELRVGPSLSNLNATVTPGGFAAPVVPRNSSGAGYNNAPLTPVLDGNANTTYLNWATQQEGPNPMPGFGTRIYLDTESYVAWGASADPAVPTSWQALNTGTLTIRGGRHSLTQYADYDALIPETNEFDNVWTGQWVWSPLGLTIGSPLTRFEPPDPGGGAYPNSDGFALSPTLAQAWVVSEAGWSPGDDYDLVAYTDYGGSTSGFSSMAADSYWGGNLTDFVVGHYGSATGASFYPAATRFNPAGGGNFFALDNSNDVGRFSSALTASWSGQTLAPYRLADVYEGYFLAGTLYHLLLFRSSGASDLSFEVFPPDYGGIYGRGDGLTTGIPSAVDQDTVEFTPSTTGWHPIVVFRNAGSDSHLPVTYHLTWSTNQLLAVDDPLPTRLEFSGVAPNPVFGHGRFRFALPERRSVRLDLFDLHGRRVATIADGPYDGGHYDVAWNGTDANGRALDPGLYWARFTAGDQIINRRVSVMR